MVFIGIKASYVNNRREFDITRLYTNENHLGTPYSIQEVVQLVLVNPVELELHK